MNKWDTTMIWWVFPGLIFLLSACRPVKVATPALATPASPTTLVPTPTLSPTPAPTETTSPTSPPTATYTPVPETARIITTTLQQSGAWNLHLPYAEPNAPELITPSLDGYQLNPEFHVVGIEMVYRWIGIGDTVMEYQQIVRHEAGFWRGATEVPADAVRKLVNSIAHLHPQPQILAATTHTDDYPFWVIELKSLDGERVLLYSESNAPNFSPWNVIYRGKIYAQFDGQIASALLALFKIGEGETLASFQWKEEEEGYLTVMNTYPFRPLSEGFSSLLPFFNDLNYTLDPQKGELSGSIFDIAWSEGEAARTIGLLNNLQKIEIDIAGGQAVACSFETTASTSDIKWIRWDFVCPLGKPGASGAYRYPIRMTFNTGVNPAYVLSGELFGYFQPGTIVSAFPYPEEIGKILEASPVVRELLSDHRMSVIKIFSLVDPATGLSDHSWKADVALLGQAQIGRRILPYSVTLQVQVEHSKLVQWDLDRSELQSLLQDVLDQPITRRFLDGDPNLVLNLYYGEDPEQQLVYEDELQPCNGIPVSSPLPAPGYPLRGFSFNQPWDFYAMQVLLMKDGLRLHYLSLDSSHPEDAFWVSSLPPEFQPRGMPPLRSISKMPFGRSVGVYWDENASASDDKRYFAMFDSLTVEKEVKKHGLFLENVTFDITPDGRLSLTKCQAP